MPVQLFGEWLPDQPAYLNTGLQTADGVFAVQNGYAPIPQFAAATNGTLAAKCLGAAAYRVDSTVYVFAGTATNLYTYNSSGYTSVKGLLTSSAEVGYRFAAFNDLMLITNGTDPIQQFDPASASATTDLDASAPTARFLAVVRGFVVAGYAADDPLRISWSDNGDPTEWTAGTGEAGFQILSTGGDITAVVGGEYGLIFQENRIVRMTYTADDAIWQFDEITADIGCVAPWSVATYGRLTFFLSNRGWMACDGVTVEAIGSEKVDRTFLDAFDRTYIENMSAAVDPRLGLYIVAVPSANPTTQVYIYHFGLKRWTTGNVTAERIFPALSQNIDMESLDAIYGDLDDIPVSLDSTLFRGGYPLLMLFDGSHRLGTLSGTPMAATLTDARRELFPGQRARITAVRPLTDAPSLTVTLGLADALSDTITESNYTMRTSAGIFRTRESASYSQVKLHFPSATQWTYVQGYDIEAVAGGRA